MTEAQRIFQERQEAHAASKLIAEETSVEASGKCAKDYAKDQEGLKWMLEHKPRDIQKFFPFLMDAPKEIADVALTFAGWNRYHESISITNHSNGIFHYRKVREKFQHSHDEAGDIRRDEQGNFIKVGRARGKWIAGAGEKTGFPFPVSLFETVDDFGFVVVCEGEKDAINLNLYGVPALTLGGVGERWEPHSEILRGRNVILWHDNDEAGMGANTRAFDVLSGVCESVMIVDWRRLDPGAETKADVSDYLIKIGRIGADALIRRLKASRYVVSVTRSWDEVEVIVMGTVQALHYERDSELAELMKIFIEAIKNDKESNAYGRVMQRADASLRKYPEKYELVQLSKTEKPSEDEKEKIAAWEKARVKGVALLEDACEDAVLYEYFSKQMVGNIRKHTQSDVVCHWVDTFEQCGVEFVRMMGEYLYWCGTHFNLVTQTQLSNTFNRFLEKASVNPSQRDQYGAFKKPSLESILDKAYHIDDVRSRWDEFAVINHQGGTIVIDEFGGISHKAHERKDYMTYVLPYEYKVGAKAKKWDAFLERVIPDPSIRMVLQEYAGYLFLPAYMQNFIFLYGMGANGKSVFIKVIASLFDDENVSYLEVQDMYDFNLDNLNGKKINISSEISGNANAKGQVELLKKIAEGATITVNPKHKNPYKITKPPKLIMSGNEKIKGGGQNDGLIRRLMMIPFDVQIPKAERNHNLHKEIIGEEMSGVLNWAIEGLIRLVKNKNQFTQSNILDDVMEEYREETDQVYLYIKECFGQYVGAFPDSPKVMRKVNELPLIYNEKIMIPTKTIYTHYCLWAKESGSYEMKQANFIAKLCEKLRTKAVSKRYKTLSVKKGYAASDNNVSTYESKQGNVVIGFTISGDIQINVNGMNMTVMETVQQGAE